jgi:hypothetical protein
MEKEFIPYEQALALKELGYSKIRIENSNTSILAYYYFGGKLIPNNRMRHHRSFNEDDMATAPLYQQAFRWLLVLANKDEHFSNKWTIKYNEDYYSLFLGGCNMGVFKAELECLKKLISIVKAK